MTDNNASEIRIEKKAILELLRTARILKRQLKILKGMKLNKDEIKLLDNAMKSVEEEHSLFRI